MDGNLAMADRQDAFWEQWSIGNFMEILFRGKTEGGKWVYGLPDYGDFNGTINVIKEFKDGCIQLYKVIPETIAPFVGVTDNKSIKIFRDDICSITTDKGQVRTVCEYRTQHTGYHLRAVDNQDGPYSVSYTYLGGKAVAFIGTIHDIVSYGPGAEPFNELGESLNYMITPESCFNQCRDGYINPICKVHK